jgi:glutamate N-acetyltransferase/amino-acid N-acetyltransferase
MFNIFPLKGYIDTIDGFYCDGVSAGFKPNGAKDIGFIYSDSLCDVEAVFTSNKFQAAPLRHYQNYPAGFQTNFVLINSKNANAMTGQAGIDDVNEVVSKLQEKFNLTNPIMSSTGVIGVRINKEKILQNALEFDLNSKNGEALSQAIMTTDAYSKHCLYEVKLSSGKSFKIGAVAKGAGMINPNLATMLCFITTDANVPQSDMKELLTQASHTTFNAISVDGDTSTNDSVFLLSNKKANCYDKEAFEVALEMVMKDMAIAIVSDGEGAKKAAAFEIKGAKDNKEAEIVAKTLSNSLLVKTALFGEDPNFGRIASTVGASGVQCSEDTLVISYENVVVYDKGEILFTPEIEAKSAKILEKESFKIICDLGIGDGKFTAYGCDLGYEYVKINADYRT